MTYCVGMLVREGLVVIADTRTNAGIDNISSYRKLHVFETPGERLIVVATAGNLSITQTALNLLEQGLPDPVTGLIETLQQAPTVLRAAQLVGDAVRRVRSEIAPALRAEGISTDVGLLVGGQVAGQAMRLFLVYSAGNFIECGPDAPFLQIGEYKYGKPILDRQLTFGTDPCDALKLGLLSVDATIRSNLAVGLPLDVVVVRRDALAAQIRTRIEENDPYFHDLGERWHGALSEAYRLIPPPPYV